MKKILLLVICALTIGVVSVSAQKKQEIKYIVNGNEVENFDGTQLEGLIIKSYKIETSKNGKEAFHFIITEDPVKVTAKRLNSNHFTANSDTIKVIGFGKNPEPVYVLNGEDVISKEEFNRLNANDIKGIEVIRKNDSEIAKKFSAEGRGVIIVWTRQSKSSTYEPLGENVKIISSETPRKVKVSAKEM